jgi:hypothetical protein
MKTTDHTTEFLREPPAYPCWGWTFMGGGQWHRLLEKPIPVRDICSHYLPDQPDKPTVTPKRGVWGNAAPSVQVGMPTPRSTREYWEAALPVGLSFSGLSQVAVEAANTIRQLEAQLAAAKQEVERYQRHVREKIYVDCTPDDGLPTRILSAHIDTTTTETFPPGLGEQMNQWQTERNAILRTALAQLSRPAVPGGEQALREALVKMEQDLWALRQQVLGASIGDPWDGEELENGFVRPIPKGFEDEVEKFDKMQSEHIKENNACLEVISELAMRCRALASAPSAGGGEALRVAAQNVCDKWNAQDATAKSEIECDDAVHELQAILAATPSRPAPVLAASPAVSVGELPAVKEALAEFERSALCANLAPSYLAEKLALIRRAERAATTPAQDGKDGETWAELRGYLRELHRTYRNLYSVLKDPALKISSDTVINGTRVGESVSDMATTIHNAEACINRLAALSTHPVPSKDAKGDEK